MVEKMKPPGLQIKLALNNKNQVRGMIQYIPIEYSPATGKDLYFINCIWILPRNKEYEISPKKGMGKALLKAAEEDVKSLNAKRIAAWGISPPFWMKASWYKRNDRYKGAILIWKPFTSDALTPL